MSGGKFSMGLKASAAGPARPPKRKAAFHDDEDENKDTISQEITHFGVEGALNVHEEKKEPKLLVIPAPTNRNWREESRRKRQKSALPVQQQTEGDGEGEVLSNTPIQYGLTVRSKADDQNRESGDTENGDAPPAEEPSANGADAPKPTEDELALKALLGGKTSNLTIPQLSEQEAYERDVEAAPDEPSLAEYTAVPVEEFGDAMLRGMGWKDGEAFGKNNKGVKAPPPRKIEKRPALMGIGAKHDKVAIEELGSWGKNSKGGDPTKKAFTPVVLKNKNTGEVLTEEELKKKMEQDTFVQEDTDGSERKRHRSEKSSRRHRDDDDYDRRVDDRDSKHRSSRDDDYDRRRGGRDSKHRSYKDDDYDRRRGEKDKYRSSRDDDYDRRRRDKDSKYRSSKDEDYDRRRGDDDSKSRSSRHDERDRDRRRKDDDSKYRSSRDDNYNSRREEKDSKHRPSRDDDYDRRRRDRS